MFDNLLPQICQIIGVKTTQDEWNPDVQTQQIILDDVPCRFDSLLLTRLSSTTDEANQPGRAGGVMFISGDYGWGDERLFDESSIIRLNKKRTDGSTDFQIMVIHDVFAADDLHHYEVEIMRGIQR